MLVRKVRNQNNFGKIILSKTEADLIRKMGLKIEDYVKQRLIEIAKERKWKWFFNKEKDSA